MYEKGGIEDAIFWSPVVLWLSILFYFGKYGVLTGVAYIVNKPLYHVSCDMKQEVKKSPKIENIFFLKIG